MINDLLNSIAMELNIPKTTDNEWACQIVYSVAGQMALASLWDHAEDSETISIQHFKGRMKQIFEAYENLIPQTRYMLPEDPSVLLDDIYDTYLRTGYLYHSAYQVSPCIPSAAAYQGVVLHRGFSPDTDLYMSGLGFYCVQTTLTENAIADMFSLQQQPFDTYLQALLENGEWTPISFPDDAEYLRLDPPFTRGYWKQEPDKDGRVSLVRYGEPNKIYQFYRYNGNQYWQKSIPIWRLQDFFSDDPTNLGEYRRIATALLMQYGTLPPISVKIERDICNINLGYRLPPSEESFFKLFSWPVRYDFSAREPQVFRRKMSIQVYPMFKHELEAMGYCFLEETI